VLELKICDPAMGSGAFLVEACRALGERLVAAWARWPEARPTIPADEDEELHARRLVAQRCLYGVDKNPRAVDLARLSLWLATLARDHEFTFLDHALKCGDSLVGLSVRQIGRLAWVDGQSDLSPFEGFVRERAQEAVQARAEIQNAPDDVMRAIQEQRFRHIEARLNDVRGIGNAVLAGFFLHDKPKQRENARKQLGVWTSGQPATYWARIGVLTAELMRVSERLQPFHWEVEFPEVFLRSNGGFDAIVGNPPYLGGKHISSNYGRIYRDYLLQSQESISGNADLCARFLRRTFDLIRSGGTAGLIATNTIAQGDTRRSGLKWICEHGGDIYSCIKRFVWPPPVAVVVSIIHILKGAFKGQRYINGYPAERISAFLFHTGGNSDPSKLVKNKNISFIGCDIKGQGFLFDDDSSVSTSVQVYRDLSKKYVDLKDVVFPYMSGEEINESPTHSAQRYVIHFGDREIDDCKNWSELLAIVEEKVRPERQSKSRELAEWPWWRFWRSRSKLYDALHGKEFAYALSRVNTWLSVARVPTNIIYSEAVVLFAFDGYAPFSVLQSFTHELWARFLSSTALELLRYGPSNCFETFPFPVDMERSAYLAEEGKRYLKYRSDVMSARNEGLTKIYNRFHDQSERSDDIQRLRELHHSMDCRVLESYGWNDLAERANPIFLNETNEDDHTYLGRSFWQSDFRDEVLARLLALNATRAAEERAAGLSAGQEDEESEVDDESERE
jgi:hypothetical protein